MPQYNVTHLLYIYIYIYILEWNILEKITNIKEYLDKYCLIYVLLNYLLLLIYLHEISSKVNSRS